MCASPTPVRRPATRRSSQTPARSRPACRGCVPAARAAGRRAPPAPHGVGIEEEPAARPNVIHGSLVSGAGSTGQLPHRQHADAGDARAERPPELVAVAGAGTPGPIEEQQGQELRDGRQGNPRRGLAGGPPHDDWPVTAHDLPTARNRARAARSRARSAPRPGPTGTTPIGHAPVTCQARPRPGEPARPARPATASAAAGPRRHDGGPPPATTARGARTASSGIAEAGAASAPARRPAKRHAAWARPRRRRPAAARTATGAHSAEPATTMRARRAGRVATATTIHRCLAVCHGRRATTA